MRTTIYLMLKIERDLVTDQLVNSVAKRLVAAMVRTKPNRYKNHAFMVNTALLPMLCTPEKYEEFEERLRKRVMEIETTRLHRVAIVYELLYSGKIKHEEDVARYVRSISANVPDSDQDWFKLLCTEYGMTVATGCGHITTPSDVRAVIVGPNWRPSTHMCSSCAQEGDRFVQTASGHFVEREHTSEALDRHLSRVLAHNQDPNFTTMQLAGRTVRVHKLFDTAAIIKGYHSSKAEGFKPIWSPWFKANKRAFGIELEMECTSSIQRGPSAFKIHAEINPSLQRGEYAFFENDGSLNSGGFEMVTQPAGLDVHREKLAKILTNPDIKRGIRSHQGGRCGLHVHVGKKYLTTPQMARIQAFVNDYRNEALIRKIARRYNAGYCRLQPQKAKISLNDKGPVDRYEMVNTMNSETIEFRVFRGSMRYESVMSAIEFVNALCVFCMPGMASISQFTSIGFKQFILQDFMKSDTKFLRGYLGMNFRRNPEQSTNDNEEEIALPSLAVRTNAQQDDIAF